MGLGAGQERIGRRRICSIGQKPRPGVAWGVDQRLDVAGLAEHILPLAAQPLGRQVGAFPRRDVVGFAADKVRAARDLGEVQLIATDGPSVAAGHATVFQQVQKVTTKCRG